MYESREIIGKAAKRNQYQDKAKKNNKTNSFTNNSTSTKRKIQNMEFEKTLPRLKPRFEFLILAKD